ncbi:hypothetical protein CLOM_g16819 [Closterium sp. NIES-68]|nr:hypothetical protein CLOM_g16819 [Closterium sp. NIES-68]GJP75615.1 hypothetical protein CLOP_g6044 [Closterium sp. NIES-67]
MRKGSSGTNAWNLAPQGGVVAVLSVLPWLYVAFDFLGSCHNGPSAKQEMYLSRLQPIIPFEQILDNVTSDILTSHHGPFYSLYLDPLRWPQLSKARSHQAQSEPRQQHWEYREVNMLAIGGSRGRDSLKLWKTAFPRGIIYGIGGNERLSPMLLQEGVRDPRVRLMVGDQANGTFLEQVVVEIKSTVGLLDFIVDDGGHTMKQQQTSLQYLLPLVKPGGTYFIENLDTSYEEGISGSDTTTMHVMQSLLDAMNKEFFEKQPYFKSMVHGKFYATPVEKLVGSVHCMRSMCALRRKSNPWY